MVGFLFNDNRLHTHCKMFVFLFVSFLFLCGISRNVFVPRVFMLNATDVLLLLLLFSVQSLHAQQLRTSTVLLFWAETRLFRFTTQKHWLLIYFRVENIAIFSLLTQVTVVQPCMPSQHDTLSTTILWEHVVVAEEDRARHVWTTSSNGQASQYRRCSALAYR